MGIGREDVKKLRGGVCLFITCSIMTTYVCTKNTSSDLFDKKLKILFNLYCVKDLSIC